MSVIPLTKQLIKEAADESKDSYRDQAQELHDLLLMALRKKRRENESFPTKVSNIMSLYGGVPGGKVAAIFTPTWEKGTLEEYLNNPSRAKYFIPGVSSYEDAKISSLVNTAKRKGIL